MEARDVEDSPFGTFVVNAARNIKGAFIIFGG